MNNTEQVTQAFDPSKETPLEYNRRMYPETVARIERLYALTALGRQKV